MSSMDEDKISTDTSSDKRKIEDDVVGPKPNTKRIKLVRPVFSPVTKSTTSTINETSKSNVHTTKIPKTINTSDPSPNMVNILAPEKSFYHSELIETPNAPPKTAQNTIDSPENIEKSVELPETTIKECIKSPETVKNVELSKNFKSSVESLEIIQTPVKLSVSLLKPCEPLETDKKSLEPHVTTCLVSEEQTDSSSDGLDIPNIFSEETKKELENLKKNIFKIEDDGSSSENDSQPKRPRLKRPTFVTPVNENKVETTNSKNFDQTNEPSKSSDSLRLVGKEIINTINSSIETQFSAIDDKETNKTSLSTNIEEEKLSNIADKNVIKKQIDEIQNVDKVSEDKLSTINKVEEKPTKFLNVHSLVEKETSKTLCFEKIVEENIKDTENACEVSQEVVDIEHNNDILIKKDIKTNSNEEVKIVEKEKVDILHEKDIVDKEKASQTNSIGMLSEERGGGVEVSKKIIESVIVNQIVKNVRVVIERYVESKSANKTEYDSKNEITDETSKEELIEIFKKECHTNENEGTTMTECAVTDEIQKSQINQTCPSFEINEYPNLENEKSCIVTQVVNKNDPSFDMSSKQLHDELESQMFKSDILKAALMSKKSLESLEDTQRSPNHQHDITPLEIKETEILPTIGEEAIVNKIEAEIKLSAKDQPTNDKSLQNTVLRSVSEIKILKEVSIPDYSYKSTTCNKNDEPPKWGSAKMNEVEKFLNDSNVTITPIVNKHQETPKLGKITLKLPKIGNPEIKSETTLNLDVKSELIKKIVNNRISVCLTKPSESLKSFAAIRPIPIPSAEQIALLEQQILNTPKKRGRPSKALAQQKQLLLQYQQQHKVQEGSVRGSVEASDKPVFHAPLFDMEDMSGGTGLFGSFNTSTPKRAKSVRGKSSRGRKGRGGCNRGRDESVSDAKLKISSMNDEGQNYQEELNEDEETKQVALIEAERLRKEELRERKLEERKKKLKERSDLLKEKKLKKKQRAEERRLQWHEKKRLMQEEKARAAEMKKSLPPPQNFDDETRMSADCNNSQSQTSARNFMMDDDLSISGTTNDSIRMKKGRMEVIDLESNKTLTVDQIAEYQWPLEGGELYMIQEQISNFLGVKSFKRKYPGLKRRNVEAEERTFLCDSGLVAESLCDLGLTVLYSSEVLDIMYADFPEKYEELREYMRLKHAKEFSNRQRALMTISSNTDGSKLDLRDRAMEAAANWNANFNKSRSESRKCSMDMQTFIVHYPKNKCKKMTIPKPKIGNYPLALLPGQFCDYYATYSSEDLRYLPLNTVMYGPLKSVDKDFPVSLSSQSESEDSSSDDSSDSDDSIDMDNKSGTNGLDCGPSDKKGAECKVCLGTAERNKKETAEPLIHCSKCLTIYHPTCLEMTLEMVPHIKRYNWQCNECKSCAQCKELADEDKMLFCDLCDRGYHIYCVGLRKVPEGRWHCQECAMCSSCGISDPGPGDSKWFYEFKRVEKTGSKVYCRTLCAPCSRSWKKGHYCPNCMRCYSIKNIERMAQCNSCDKFLHPECISENTTNRQVVTCTICEEKAVSRLLTTVPRSLIKV